MNASVSDLEIARPCRRPAPARRPRRTRHCDSGTTTRIRCAPRRLRPVPVTDDGRRRARRQALASTASPSSRGSPVRRRPARNRSGRSPDGRRAPGRRWPAVCCRAVRRVRSRDVLCFSLSRLTWVEGVVMWIASAQSGMLRGVGNDDGEQIGDCSQAGRVQHGRGNGLVVDAWQCSGGGRGGHHRRRVAEVEGAAGGRVHAHVRHEPGEDEVRRVRGLETLVKIRLHERVRVVASPRPARRHAGRPRSTIAPLSPSMS